MRYSQAHLVSVEHPRRVLHKSRLDPSRRITIPACDNAGLSTLPSYDDFLVTHATFAGQMAPIARES
jgi:hypothetical protein